MEIDFLFARLELFLASEGLSHIQVEKRYAESGIFIRILPSSIFKTDGVDLKTDLRLCETRRRLLLSSSLSRDFSSAKEEDAVEDAARIDRVLAMTRHGGNNNDPNRLLNLDSDVKPFDFNAISPPRSPFDDVNSMSPLRDGDENDDDNNDDGDLPAIVPPSPPEPLTPERTPSKRIRCKKCSILFPDRSAYLKHRALLHKIVLTTPRKRRAKLKPPPPVIPSQRSNDGAGGANGEDFDGNEDAAAADGFEEDNEKTHIKKCRTCDIAFPDLRSHRRHYMKHHRKPIVCQFCGTTRSGKRGLMRHIKSFHR